MAAEYSGTPQARKLELRPSQPVTPDELPSRWRFADPLPGLVYMDAQSAAGCGLGKPGLPQRAHGRLSLRATVRDGNDKEASVFAVCVLCGER